MLHLQSPIFDQLICAARAYYFSSLFLLLRKSREYRYLNFANVNLALSSGAENQRTGYSGDSGIAEWRLRDCRHDAEGGCTCYDKVTRCIGRFRSLVTRQQAPAIGGSRRSIAGRDNLRGARERRIGGRRETTHTDTGEDTAYVRWLYVNDAYLWASPRQLVKDEIRSIKNPHVEFPHWNRQFIFTQSIITGAGRRDPLAVINNGPL